MIRQLMYKWFGLSEPECKTCQILERELDTIRRERDAILDKFLNPIVVPVQEREEPEDLKPIRQSGRRFIPHVVRQQMLDASDKRSLELMLKFRKEQQERNEKSVLGTKKSTEEKDNASKVRETVSVHADDGALTG